MIEDDGAALPSSASSPGTPSPTPTPSSTRSGPAHLHGGRRILAPVVDASDHASWRDAAIPDNVRRDVWDWLREQRIALTSTEIELALGSTPLFDGTKVAADRQRLIDYAYMAIHLRDRQEAEGRQSIGDVVAEVVARIVASQPVPRLGLTSGSNLLVALTDVPIPDENDSSAAPFDLFAMLVAPCAAVALDGDDPSPLRQLQVDVHVVDPEDAWIQDEGLSRVRFGSELIRRTKGLPATGSVGSGGSSAVRVLAPDGCAGHLCIPSAGQHYVGRSLQFLV